MLLICFAFVVQVSMCAYMATVHCYPTERFGGETHDSSFGKRSNMMMAASRQVRWGSVGWRLIGRGRQRRSRRRRARGSEPGNKVVSFAIRDMRGTRRVCLRPRGQV